MKLNLAFEFGMWWRSKKFSATCSLSRIIAAGTSQCFHSTHWAYNDKMTLRFFCRVLSRNCWKTLADNRLS